MRDIDTRVLNATVDCLYCQVGDATMPLDMKRN